MVSKLFIDLGIKLQMPENERKRMCNKCGTLHEVGGDCPTEEDFYAEPELVNEEAANAMGVNMEKLKQMLGRDKWKGKE